MFSLRLICARGIGSAGNLPACLLLQDSRRDAGATRKLLSIYLDLGALGMYQRLYAKYARMPPCGNHFAEIADALTHQSQKRTSKNIREQISVDNLQNESEFASLNLCYGGQLQNVVRDARSTCAWKFLAIAGPS